MSILLGDFIDDVPIGQADPLGILQRPPPNVQRPQPKAEGQSAPAHPPLRTKEESVKRRRAITVRRIAQQLEQLLDTWGLV